jgi:hypothetical protein
MTSLLPCKPAFLSCVCLYARKIKQGRRSLKTVVLLAISHQVILVGGLAPDGQSVS